MNSKNCTKCKNILPINMFNKNGKYYKSRCKKCTQEDEVLYRIKHPEREKLKKLKYLEKYREKILKEQRLYQSKYKKENKYKVNASNKMRRYEKMLRTPKWLTNEEKWLIQEVYHLAQLRTELTKTDWHVDHIIPIKGNFVSGLHIVENLQVILAKENLIKNNRYLNC